MEPAERTAPLCQDLCLGEVVFCNDVKSPPSSALSRMNGNGRCLFTQRRHIYKVSPFPKTSFENWQASQARVSTPGVS